MGPPKQKTSRLVCKHLPIFENAYERRGSAILVHPFRWKNRILYNIRRCPIFELCIFRIQEFQAFS